MTLVRYDGPTGAVNRDVGRATGEGHRLVTGKVYDVPPALADALMRNAGWTKAAPKPPAIKKADAAPKKGEPAAAAKGNAPAAAPSITTKPAEKPAAGPTTANTPPKEV